MDPNLTNYSHSTINPLFFMHLFIYSTELNLLVSFALIIVLWTVHLMLKLFYQRAPVLTNLGSPFAK